MSPDKLNEAILKAKSGDKVAAGKLLSEYVRENPTSEAAWLWLSICVVPIDQKRFCLKKALAINPMNENAQKALAQLDSPPPPLPSFTELSSNQPISTIESSPKSNQSLPSFLQSANNPKFTPPASAKTKSPVVPMEQVGGYVRSILLPNETVLATAKINWTIFFWPTAFTILSIIVTLVTRTGLFPILPGYSDSVPAAANNFMSALCCIPLWLIGIFLFIVAFLRYRTTEFALTDKRAIGKYGIINRNSLELVLGKIESIRVDQSIWGRVFNFGTLVVTGSGGTHQRYPHIAAPMEMKRKINAILAE